jgi:hypothetical protein
MVVLILFIIIAICATAALIYSYIDDMGLGSGLLLGNLMGIVVSLFIFGAYLGVNRLVSFAEDNPPRVVTTYKLKALSDGSVVSGRFFLFAGHIDSQDVFYYYVDRGHGRYIRRHVNADSVEIDEDTETGAYARFIRDPPSKMRTWAAFLANAEYLRKVEFHVPKGTVKGSFDLDNN